MSFTVRNINNLDQAGKNFGEGLGEGYMQGSDERTIRKAVESLPPNASYRDILNAVSGASVYNPKSKQQALENYVKSHEIDLNEKKLNAQVAQNEIKQNQANAKIKEGEARTAETARHNKAVEEAAANKVNTEITDKQQKKAQANAILDQLDLPEEKKKALKDNITLEAAESMLKDQNKVREDKLTPVERKLQEKAAEDYIALNEQIPVLEDTIQNIDEVERIANDLGAFGINWLGPLSGLVGTEKAKELEAESFPLIQPIVKMFNPTGPIATQKLKIIQDKYQIKATDTPPVIKGKITALRRFAKQALARAQARKKLFEDNQGTPTQKQLEKFDKDSETMTDAMVDYELTGEEVNIPELPSAQAYKGKTITSPDGEKFFSDGVKWMKK